MYGNTRILYVKTVMVRVIRGSQEVNLTHFESSLHTYSRVLYVYCDILHIPCISTYKLNKNCLFLGSYLAL
jgi:uncharacterized MAPEG superfamily protein